MTTQSITRRPLKLLSRLALAVLAFIFVARVAPAKAAIGPTSFAAKADFATNAGPSNVAIGDIDGDGKADLVVTNYGSVANIGNTISVLRNTSTSGTVAFAPKVDFAVNNGPHELAIGDLDGDGKQDLVIVHYGAYAGGNTISILRNTSTVGNVAFAPLIDFTVNTGPIGIEISDLNGDGKPDISLNQFYDGRGTLLSVFRNTSTSGNISFAPKVDFSIGTGPYEVASGDMDGDGKPDLVIANNGSLNGDGNTMSVLRNTSTTGGAISFAPKVDFTTNNGPRGVGIGDFDGDGKPDVAISHFGGGGAGNTVSILRNLSTVGNLQFAPKVDFSVNTGAIRVVVGDIDKDGKLDIATANFGTTTTGGSGNTVSVLRNTSTVGTIAFAAKVDFITGTGPHGLTIGDVDGDGWLELIAADYGTFSGDGATVSVLRNLNGSPTTVVPNVVGLTQAAAQQTLTSAGLAVGTITQTYNNSVPAGSVISQSPAAGASVVNGSAINLVVSLGPTPTNVTVPNVVGLTQAAAQQSITSAGLAVGTITQAYNASVPAGSVISQTPTAGASVALNTSVNLVVSLGASPVTVPNVVGLTQTAAQQAITSAGLSVGAVTQAYNSSVPAGNVVSQSPAAGNAVPLNTAINLVVSRGPAPGNIAISANAFAPKVDFTTNNGPTGVAIGDFDGDGQSDIAIANYGYGGNIGNTIAVLRGTGTSGNVAFAPKVDLATNNGPYSIALGDLDGDGKPDLAVTHYGASGSGNTVSVFRNTSTSGNLGFAPKVDFTVNTGPIGIAIGDLDGDGKPDLAVTQFNEGSGALVSVLRNTSTSGSIAFAAKIDFTVGVGATGVAIGDLDGDGKPDLAVTNNGSFAGDGNTVSILRNTGSPGNLAFAAKVDFGTNNGPRGIALGDADGDGKLDLLIANFGNGSSGNTVSALRNTSTSGNIAFAPKVDFAVGSGALNVAFRDLNGDGKFDLVVANFSSGSISVLQNTSTSGTLAFAAKVDFTTGAGAFNTAVGDLDGDSWPDVVVTNYGNGANNTISVLRNLLGTPPAVTVPNVVGLTQAAAQQAITSAGLTVGTITQAYNSTVAAGNVISQNPAAGASISSGSAVALVISLGTAPVTVPNVVGLTQAAAQQALTNAGLTVGNMTQSNSSTIPAGSVISQNPAAGASVATGTAVALDVSLGPAPVALTVTKGGNGSGTVTSTPAGITCGATCSANFNANTVVTLSATASTGSAFTGWSGSCTGTGACQVTMDAAKSVTANFALITYVLAVTKSGNGGGTVTSTPAGINCGATCSANLTANTVVALVAAANPGSTFTGWSGSCTGTGTCQVTMDAAKTVTANFTLNTYALAVVNSGNGSGTVSSAPAGINCGTTCSVSLNYGTVITLTATASTGSTFTGWSGSCTGTGVCKVTIDAAKNVTANFTLITYALSITKIGNGSGTVTSTPAGISCGTICSANFTANTLVTLSAVASTGSSSIGWSGSCTGSGGCQVTMNAAKSVTANFTLNPHVLSVKRSGNGSGTVTSTPSGINCGTTCSVSVNYGTVITLTATPSTGSSFTGWSGNCTGTGACVLTVNAAKNVTATFALKSYTLTLSKSGGGTVTSTPTGIACGSTCSAPYLYNTTVTLNAVADAGWTFKGWSGDLAGTTPSSAITMNGNKNVVATFSDLIFADSFEAGNLAAWTSATTDAGNLSVAPAAKLAGVQGLQAVINDNNSLYVTDDTPSAEARYRARFYFDPNSIRMTSGDAHYIFFGYSGTSTVALFIEFRYLSPNYQLRAGLVDNFGLSRTSSWFNISDAPHFVEFDWQAATNLLAINGYLTFWIDGAQVANLSGVANSILRIDRVRLGAVSGIDSGTRGTYYLDAFEAHRQAYIGPANGAAFAADVQVAPMLYLPLVVSEK